MSKKVLVTGGAGGIGFHLSKLLADKGYQVVIADNFYRGQKDVYLETLLERSNVTLQELDLTNANAWSELDTDFDYIYQLAGVNGTHLFYEKPAEVLHIGVTTILNSLEWLRKQSNRPKMLYTSSNEAYAGALESFNQLPIPTPETVPLVVSDVNNPRWSYGGSKLIGELFYLNYHKQYDLDTVIVRPHNFYGPRTGYSHVIPQFIERIERREDPFTIYGANETRTFCYITDAVEAMQAVVESESSTGGIYHIGQKPEDEITINDLAKKLFDISGWTPKDTSVENSPEGSVKRRAADISKISNEIGWSPSTDLMAGLEFTYKWYVENPKT